MDTRAVTAVVSGALGVAGVVALGIAWLATPARRLDLAVPDVGVRDLDGREIDVKHGDWVVNVWLPG